MNFKNRFLILTIIVIFLSVLGLSFASNYENMADGIVIVNDTADDSLFGCCSIVFQMDGKDTLMSYRRDSNETADVHIEKVVWHGIPAIKQYKTDGGYFNHVIVTDDGWVIGLGGINDGSSNEKCENITADMINDDYKISKSSLEKIQEILKPYGRGHAVIKAPNGNYGFACVDMLKTGKLEPGHYISIPNNYSLSRSGELSIYNGDKIEIMNDLSQSDKYGLDRREIITYEFRADKLFNKTNIYVANEDGSKLGVDYTGCIDDVYFNNTLFKAKDIPIAPDYQKMGEITFINEDSNLYKLIMLVTIIVFVFFVAILYFIVLKLVRFIRYRIFR